MVVDYKSRKNEVLSSYDTVEELITELRDYAEKINLPAPDGCQAMYKLHC